MSIVAGVGIPLLAYFSWFAYFSYANLYLEWNTPDAVVDFAITTSATIAVISLIFHIGYSLYSMKKLNDTMDRLHAMNSRVQVLSEDLSEVTNYNLEMVTEIAKDIAKDPSCKEKAQPTLQRISDLAEEISLRADKAAAAVEQVDGHMKGLNPDGNKKSSKLVRLWESAYNYR